MTSEDQGEPSGPDWWIWPLMALATLFALAGIVGSLAALFGFLG